MRIQIDPGTEQWLGFAQSKLFALKSRMHKGQTHASLFLDVDGGDTRIFVDINGPLESIRIQGGAGTLPKIFRYITFGGNNAQNRITPSDIFPEGGGDSSLRNFKSINSGDDTQKVVSVVMPPISSHFSYKKTKTRTTLTIKEVLSEANKLFDANCGQLLSDLLQPYIGKNSFRFILEPVNKNILNLYTDGESVLLYFFKDSDNDLAVLFSLELANDTLHRNSNITGTIIRSAFVSTSPVIEISGINNRFGTVFFVYEIKVIDFLNVTNKFNVIVDTEQDSFTTSYTYGSFTADIVVVNLTAADTTDTETLQAIDITVSRIDADTVKVEFFTKFNKTANITDSIIANDPPVLIELSEEKRHIIPTNVYKEHDLRPFIWPASPDKVIPTQFRVLSKIDEPPFFLESISFNIFGVSNVNNIAQDNVSPDKLFGLHVDRDAFFNVEEFGVMDFAVIGLDGDVIVRSTNGILDSTTTVELGIPTELNENTPSNNYEFYKNELFKNVGNVAISALASYNLLPGIVISTDLSSPTGNNPALAKSHIGTNLSFIRAFTVIDDIGPTFLNGIPISGSALDNTIYYKTTKIDLDVVGFNASDIVKLGKAISVIGGVAGNLLPTRVKQEIPPMQNVVFSLSIAIWFPSAINDKEDGICLIKISNLLEYNSLQAALFNAPADEKEDIRNQMRAARTIILNNFASEDFIDQFPGDTSGAWYLLFK